ncbi:MAG: phosphoglycerate dehydrogenase [Gammaproteobacteria bacterium]
MNVLLLEGIHPAAAERLAAAGCEARREAGSPEPEILAAALAETTLLGIRSKTQVTEALLDQAPDLLALGAFCIGTNQIDLDACTRRGIVVFNAPFSNTRSVAELAIAEIVLLLRNLPDKLYAMHAGRWQKSATGSHEVRGKTLGIVGYGKIGMQLSVLAEALGMRVLYFDLAERLAIGNAVRAASLGALLAQADVVTLHVDGRATNYGLMDAAAIARMKPGAILLNLSRGYVVDTDALSEAIAAGRIGGAALDVYPEEPASKQSAFATPLAQVANVILTPHIGGSTEEAQLDIGQYVSGRLADYLANGGTIGSVNFPEIAAPRPPGTCRIAHLHENMPGRLAAINQVLAEHGLNVAGQHLATAATVGYVLTDVDGVPGDAVLVSLSAIPHSLRARLLAPSVQM